MSTLRLLVIRQKGTQQYCVARSYRFGPLQDAVLLRSDREAMKKLKLLNREYLRNRGFAQSGQFSWLERFLAPQPELEIVPIEIAVDDG